MKIAVLADIHSNFIALQEVYYHIESWHPDFIIVAGDMVNRGPDPFDCVQFLHQKSIEDNWVLLTGNHEEYVIEKFENFDSLSEFERQLHKPSIWTGQKLKSEYQFIKSLPDKLKLVGPDLREVRIVHGSMLGSRDGIYTETPASSLEEKITGKNTFDNSMEAHLAADKLKAAGIEYFLADEGISEIYPAVGLFEIRLMVTAADKIAALKILNQD